MTEKSLPKLDWRVVFNRAAPPGSRGWGRVRAAQLKAMGPAMTVAAKERFRAAFPAPPALASAEGADIHRR